MIRKTSFDRAAKPISPAVKTGVGNANRVGMAAALILVAGSVISLLPPEPANAAVQGPYLVANASSHLCMDVSYGRVESGARIQQWWCYGGKPEQWTFAHSGISDPGYNAGYYSILNQNSGKCLEVPGKNPSVGTELQQWRCSGSDAQLWRILPFTIRSTGELEVILLRNRLTGLCLSTHPRWGNNEGSALQAQSCDSLRASQRWKLMSAVQ